MEKVNVDSKAKTNNVQLHNVKDKTNIVNSRKKN